MQARITKISFCIKLDSAYGIYNEETNKMVLRYKSHDGISRHPGAQIAQPHGISDIIISPTRNELELKQEVYITIEQGGKVKLHVYEDKEGPIQRPPNSRKVYYITREGHPYIIVYGYAKISKQQRNGNPKHFLYSNDGIVKIENRIWKNNEIQDPTKGGQLKYNELNQDQQDIYDNDDNWSEKFYEPAMMDVYITNNTFRETLEEYYDLSSLSIEIGGGKKELIKPNTYFTFGPRDNPKFVKSDKPF